MNINDKDSKIIKKSFERESSLDRIRLGNKFVDDFLFDDQQISDIPINALRVIFNIISIMSSEQFRPEDRPRQLNLFEDEYETDNNVFVSMKIRNNKISPSGSTKQVIDAYEFLAKFKMGWYKSQNSKGKEIRTFGGLISTPTYDQRGYTSFLISSYWLKRIVVIPEYNYILYHLVYHVKSNKHILFAIWLSKLPDKGIMIKLSTLNKKFGLNYKSSKEFCSKFLKLVKLNLDLYNNLSFQYKYQSDSIFLFPQKSKNSQNNIVIPKAEESFFITKRLRYFKKRHALQDKSAQQFIYHYQNISQTRIMIEVAYKEIKREYRLRKTPFTELQGIDFLNEIQNKIILHYQWTKAGKIFPQGFPVII
ncbi:hypothetical protein [Cloacibacterium normanense]|uniref:hypothetical protein n=1 Tax=Cloacibacterium normanense TaxID=237258 RepID=UPI00391C6896